jgi:hypothetical protein
MLPASEALSPAAAHRAINALEDHTGLALAPGLALLARGIYVRMTAEDGAKLPWHASEKFLIVLGCVLGLFLVKDFIPVEPLQKFLAAGEEGSMMAIGLMAYAAAIPGLAGLLGPAAGKVASLAAPLLFASPAFAQGGASDPALVSALASAMAHACGTVVFAVVWCVSNSINVLLLLAPSFAAPFLKGFRLAVAGGLAGLGAVHPLLGLVGAIAVIIVCVALVRWSYKLTAWGIGFSFDLVFLRWRRPDPALSGGNGTPRARAYATGAARRRLRVPKRASGILEARDGQLFFRYRRLLIFRREVPVPGPAFVLRRMLAPALAVRDPGSGRVLALFAFRLRHRGHEELLCRALGLSGTEDWGLSRAKARAFQWLKGLFKKGEEEVPAW